MMNDDDVHIEPLVSIVVPVYNVDQYCDDCLRSIIGQTYRNLEIILVDDGSTDDCPALCDQWAAVDDRISVIHQRNQGLSGARNTGLDHAHGEYVLCVDSDDVIDSTLVEQCIRSCTKQGSDMVMYSYDCVSENGDEHWAPVEASFFPAADVLPPDDVLRLLLTSKLTYFAWKFIARRSLYEDYKVRFPVGHKFEDVGTTYKIVSAAGIVSLINQPLYHYRQRSGSILHERKAVTPMYRDVMYVTDGMVEFMRTERPHLALLSETYRAVFFIRLAWSCLFGKERPEDYDDAIRYLRAALRRTLPIRMMPHIPYKQIIRLMVVMLMMVKESIRLKLRRHRSAQ
ncbi:glycosyltransferase [Bifidobacterium bifidum]|uniref:glycosyltransferase n=1 Tax=Bifidobacterium bifidum TaxID=1681 RepID=UPI0012AB50C3|nr:glycosyltransferase [Bifidobacterium bifidum]